MTSNKGMKELKFVPQPPSLHKTTQTTPNQTFVRISLGVWKGNDSTSLRHHQLYASQLPSEKNIEKIQLSH